jgi:HlyD family secretion protein
MKYFLPGLLLVLIISCNNNGNKSDAYGNFEATEVIVSSEATGKILSLNIREGEELLKDGVVGLVDTAQLFLKKQQLFALRKVTIAKTGNINTQADVLLQQRQNLLKDSIRIANLLKEEAATQKQFDDLNGQLRVIEKQLRQVEFQQTPVADEIKSIDSQVASVADQLAKSVIRNPIKGRVLVKYAEPGEITAFGKPLYKIANLDTLTLRVYVSGDQLSSIKIGQEVKVIYDEGKTADAESKGVISWISGEAEFTPKVIQTKEERVNLVYAVKVLVPNSGELKIGMPGEIRFAENKTPQ